MAPGHRNHAKTDNETRHSPRLTSSCQTIELMPAKKMGVKNNDGDDRLCTISISQIPSHGTGESGTQCTMCVSECVCACKHNNMNEKLAS